MQDLDSAVGRLDNILITIYVFVVILIFTVAMVSHTAPFTYSEINVHVAGCTIADTDSCWWYSCSR